MDLAGIFSFNNNQGKNFFELISYIRIVILQDAAILLTLDEFKSHPIFQHKIFQLNEFKQYQKSLLEAVASSKAPEHMDLERVAPIISEQLAELRGDSVFIKGQISKLDTKLGNHIEKFDDTLKTELMNVVGNQNRILTHVFSSFAQFGNVGNELLGEVVVPNNQNSQTEIARCSCVANAVDSFVMSRDISTVRDAWTEYLEEVQPLENVGTYYRS
jgi:hypothetical protein